MFDPADRLGRLASVLAIVCGLAVPSVVTGHAAAPSTSNMHTVAPDPAPFTGPDAPDLTFRRDEGLSTDVANIHALKGQWAAGTLVRPAGAIPWPVVLSPTEQQEIDFRVLHVEPAWRSSTIQNYLGAHRDTFAGNYFDNAAGGKQTFLFTADVDTRAAELRSIYPYPDRLVVRQATYTDEQLRTWYVTLSDDLDQLTSLGITQVAVDTINNALLLMGPSGSDPNLLPTLASRYGDLPLELQQAAALGTAQGYTGSIAAPLRSGTELNSTAGYLGVGQCSLGWNLYNGSNFYISTAGHCGPDGRVGPPQGTGWVQGGTPQYNGCLNNPPSCPLYAGNTVSNTLENAGVCGGFFCNVHSDASVISIPTSWRSAYLVTSPGAQYWVKNMLGQNQDQPGMSVCRSGIHDGGQGYWCDTERNNKLTWQTGPMPWFSSAGAPAGTKYMYQRWWTDEGADGDSGAPMFTWAGPTTVTAVGQWVGMPPPGNYLDMTTGQVNYYAYYTGSWSTIFDVTSNLGVGLVTCGGC